MLPSPAQLALVVFTLIELGLQVVWSHGSHQLTYILQHSKKECFSRVWTDSERIFFEYQVLRGGQKDVDVQIITPNGMVLYERQRSSKDEVTFTPQNGEFRFCFGNEFSKISDKVVAFNIRPVYTDSLSQEAGQNEPTVKDSSAMSCDKVHEAMTAVTDFQRKYRVREAIGRHLAERLNKTVFWWSAVQTAAILLCGVGQVLVLKMFFTDRRSSSILLEQGQPEKEPAVAHT